MGRNDPVLTMLKGINYLPVRLPRADIQPLELLSKDRSRFDRLGPIDQLFRQGNDIPLPTIDRAVTAANVGGSRTSALNIGVGINVMGDFLAAMGGSQLGLKSKFEQANKVTFEFANVTEDSTDVIALDQYLVDADVSPYSRDLARRLEDDTVYAISACLKSDSFSVEATASSGGEVSLDVPAIQQIVGANVEVSAASSSTSTVKYTGKIPLVFGFQAVRLFFYDGIYRSLGPSKGGALAVEDQIARAEIGTIFARLGEGW